MKLFVYNVFFLLILQLSISFCMLLNSFKMTSITASGLQMATLRPCIYPSGGPLKHAVACFGIDEKRNLWNKIASIHHISSGQPFRRMSTSYASKATNTVTKAMSESRESNSSTGLSIDLRGQSNLDVCPDLLCLYPWMGQCIMHLLCFIHPSGQLLTSTMCASFEFILL